MRFIRDNIKYFGLKQIHANIITSDVYYLGRKSDKK